MQCSGIIQLLVTIIHTVIINTNGNPGVCHIEKYTLEEIGIPEVPEFLKQKKETYRCRGTQEGTKLLYCEKEFILPKCICSYHHVANKSNHDYTACGDNSKEDSIRHMTCAKCRDYSINQTGPCLNGGKVSCTSDDELAADLFCSCPKNYSGTFCEKGNVTSYRICHVELQESNLPNCHDRPEEVCKVVTASKNFTCPLNSSEEKLHQHCSSMYDLVSNNSKAPERHQVKTVNSSSFLQETFITLVCLTLLQITLSS
ncbi:uncharacterized protein LOC133175813 [Saccostrea echinata]|uniref:uncharacterized protein LOC133175813 n=1 Tax=Saccostrea echinata TaxID=191078 RepID=UPI002A800D96|nr:uncharacterized protein LOC133175813 [Saccostrea echinata]XP_061166916.1 uncharacterized protein LOC133175813 [Saccostrea echinata]XP_061166917.1 uncharacterized protein LOC133175813 [Saccostrea echinata]XP_061166918.1 uncharacterized protein LOC133175813 [Saccostrea echinata]XP_061166919.1 uncharacterized protein LOC133175813 [Saccostrea echinata]XP_061166920.1 uncharacterized protein LOC133175813 [Saccostrea echinata]XP_061166921.1 uncharacterized protein LOC133175813 [Saccostrea echinat